MAIRKLTYIGSDILRQKARKVRDFDAKLHKLLNDMADTLVDERAPGVGLAAPQVGVSERVIVVRLPDDDEWREEYGDEAGKLHEVVNPEIVKAARETEEATEACLSIPGYFGTVERSTAVTVRGQDRNGKEIRIKAYDWLARVFLHEIDHLDGILFIDRASEVWKAGEEPPHAVSEAIAEEAGDAAD
jgi:peptide deformylase